jgi:L-amino acid N-acyltransferase
VNDLVIRLATPGDLGAINEIYNYNVAYCTCTWQTEPSTDAERAAWLDAHDAAHPATVAVIAGEVVGWGSLSQFHGRCGYRHTVEDSVYVRNDMQRKGIGRAILADLVARGKAAGHHTIIASISADQKPSIALHERFGFVEVARMREVGTKFGAWLDLVYMQLML